MFIIVDVLKRSGDVISVMHTAPADPALLLSIDFIWQPIHGFFKIHVFSCWWPTDRVYISTSFKNPRETTLSKQNFFCTLCSERTTGIRVQFGKISRWKLVFIITRHAFTRAAKNVVKVEYFPVEFLCPASELRWRRCC